MRLLKTHSCTSERLGYEGRKYAKKTIEGTGLPRSYDNTAVLQCRGIPSVGVWGLGVFAFLYRKLQDSSSSYWYAINIYEI